MAPSLHDTLEETLALLPAAFGRTIFGPSTGDLLVRDAPAAIAQLLLIPTTSFK